jgi:hypothetical protein
MIETPPPDAARHHAQHRAAPADHSARERDRHVLAGANKPPIDGIEPAAGHHQYP